MGAVAVLQQANLPFQAPLQLAALSVLYWRFLNGPLAVTNPTFVRVHVSLIDYSDAELYLMRITSRAHIPLLVHHLQMPPFIVCDNRCRMASTECYLLWLSFISNQMRMQDLQARHGLEYSQVSRFLKFMWLFMWMRAQPKLAHTNLPFFVARFQHYQMCIAAKYTALHGVAMDPRYTQVAMFTDGTQRRMPRNRRTNYSGHKKMYCLGFLATVTPDGMLSMVNGPFAGRRNDHGKQNKAQLSQRLVAAQAGNAIVYSTSTDKGLHWQPCVIPMHNNLWINPAQALSNTRWAAMRVVNENVIGLPPNNFRYIDNWKSHSSRQPLGLFYMVACFQQNLITCLDWNQCSAYFNCPPPTLAQYL